MGEDVQEKHYRAFSLDKAIEKLKRDFGDVNIISTDFRGSDDGPPTEIEPLWFLKYTAINSTEPPIKEKP